MNDENNFGGSPLDDIEYSAPKSIISDIPNPRIIHSLYFNNDVSGLYF